MNVLANLQLVRERIERACARCGRRPDTVTLVAVTKTAPLPRILELYQLGIRDFAENRPQMVWQKHAQVPMDVRWHLIGHLQTNKVRRTLPLVRMIHSVDRMPVAEALSSECVRSGRSIDITLEANLTGEETKHGFRAAELIEHFPSLLALPGLKVLGLMTMARLEEEVERCRPTFRELRELRDRLEQQFAVSLPALSMGMSGDFEVAIEEGATHIRVGSALFQEQPG